MFSLWKLNVVKMDLIESIVELRDCLFDESGVWPVIWAHVWGGREGGDGVRRGGELGEWAMGIRGDGFLFVSLLLSLMAVLGIEKMLLVPRVASEVCRMVTSAVDAFWGSSFHTSKSIPNPLTLSVCS